MKAANVTKTLATIRALGLVANYRNGEYAINVKGGDEDTRYYAPDAEDAVESARQMVKHEAEKAEKSAEQFLERRAAMRHAIRVLRERKDVTSIDRTDADTLEAWLEELQAAQ